MLLYVNSSSLQSTPPHLCVEGKKPKARVLGKATFLILEEMGEIVASSHLIAALSQEVCSSSRGQCGEGHTVVSLCAELVDWSSSNGGPHNGMG